VVELKRKFDYVWIGYWKVRVNRQKYSRDREPRHERNVEPKPILAELESQGMSGTPNPT